MTIVWTKRLGVCVCVCVCVYAFYLCNVASILQVVLKQLGGTVLKRLGQSCQQHCELWSVELEQ